MGQRIDLDTPQELPLGHAFIGSQERTAIEAVGPRVVTFDKSGPIDFGCQFLMDNGAWCGKTAAEHAPVPAAWWAAMWAWVKGGLQ